MENSHRHLISSKAMLFPLVIITTILLGAVVKIASAVILPLTFSLLLSIVAIPIVKLLVKFRIPRIVSITLVLFLFVGVLVVVGIFFYSSGQVLITTFYPKYETRIKEIYIFFEQFFGLPPYNESLSVFGNIWGQDAVRRLVNEMTISFSNGIIGVVENVLKVGFFMFFILLQSVFFKVKLDKAFEGTVAEKINKISSSVITQVTHYLSIKFYVSLLSGIVVATGLEIIGLEFAILWGVFQFVFNFIPVIGSFTVGVAATAFSLIQFWPNPVPFLASGLVILCSKTIIGTILEPLITGDKLRLSTLLIIVFLLVWGWLWGFAGLILAVPIMATIKIVCENIPRLEPISILMESGVALPQKKAKEKLKRGD